MSSSPDFLKPKSVARNPQSGIFQWGFQCGFSVGFSVGSSVDCFSVTIWYTDRWHNQCGIILFFVFLKSKMKFPSRQNLTFHLAKPYLSQGKTLSFAWRNHIFCKAKPYLSHDETLSFARRNLIFCKVKPYLSQGETISFTRRNHIFYKAKPYLSQGKTISFARWNHIFYKHLSHRQLAFCEFCYLFRLVIFFLFIHLVIIIR